MSDNQNDAKLYSMQDVNSMAGKPASSAAANVRPIKQTAKKKNKWASDEDANDLLAGILDETEDAAKAEEARRQRELEAKERARRDEEAREDAARKAEGDRLKREEEARRAQADVRRTGLLEAIHGPSKEKLEAEARAAEEARQKEEMERRIAEADRARREAERAAADAAREAKRKEQERLEALARQADAPPPKSNTGLIIGIVAAVVAVVLLGGGVALFVLSGNDPNANQTYAKTTLDARAFTTASVEKEFQAIEKPKPVEAEDDNPKAARRRTAGAGGRKATNNQAGNSKSKRNFGNVFGGGGGIVF